MYANKRSDIVMLLQVSTCGTYQPTPMNPDITEPSLCLLCHGINWNCIVYSISVDTVPPVIMNCDPTVEDFEVGTQSVNVTWTEPTVSDLSGSPVIVNQSASPPLELKTNQTVHLVHYTFEDAAGNSAECDLLILLFPGLLLDSSTHHNAVNKFHFYEGYGWTQPRPSLRCRVICHWYVFFWCYEILQRVISVI